MPDRSPIPLSALDLLPPFGRKGREQECQTASERWADLDQLLQARVARSSPSTSSPVNEKVRAPRPKLLSHEAVTFAVLHHMSNLVRYRPSDGEKLLGSTGGWYSQVGSTEPQSPSYSTWSADSQVRTSVLT